MSLKEAWDRQADAWARFVPLDEVNERFNVPKLLELLPPPGRRTLDLGCGEGRLGRELLKLGHRVVGIDSSAAMVRHASRSHESLVADATALPFEDGAFDLVTAFMSIMDMDDMAGAVREVGRVLTSGGHFCFSITHPINSAGRFVERAPDSPFVIEHGYLEERRFVDPYEREGVEIEFHAVHRPLEAYSRALEAAGLAIETLLEHPLPDELNRTGAGLRWQRVPLFLHAAAVKR